MNKVRTFIITNSIVLSIWLAASFFTAADPVDVAVTPAAPSELSADITQYEVK